MRSVPPHSNGAWLRRLDALREWERADTEWQSTGSSLRAWSAYAFVFGSATAFCLAVDVDVTPWIVVGFAFLCAASIMNAARSLAA